MRISLINNKICTPGALYGLYPCSEIQGPESQD